jgi:hypothetical protein
MPAASKTSKSKSQTTKGRNEPPYVYVYCAVSGAVNARALSRLPALPDGSAPRVLRVADDISLVVADVAAKTYRAGAVEARLTDLDWVGRCGTAHHAVADALVARHTVAPVRPFTLFASEARARETFAGLAGDLRQAFERVTGKTEWVLRIGTPEPTRMTVADERGRSNEVTSGTSFLEQKAAAKRAATQLAARVRHDAAAVYEALKKVADVSNERATEPGTGLLLDAAFLVPVRDTTAFKRVLEAEAKGLLRDGCRVSLTGPWPPYSFVSLDSEGGRD